MVRTARRTDSEASSGDTADYTLPLHGVPGHLVRRLNQISTALFADEMQRIDVDLTPVQFAALTAISAFPRIDQATLSAVIAYDRATIGGVIDRLEAKGLVRRIASAADRRVRQLQIQPKGAALLARVGAAVSHAQKRMLEPLSAGDRATFLKLLTKLLAKNVEGSRFPRRAQSDFSLVSRP